MQKNLLRVQSVLFYLFAALSIGALVLSLSFMTDFKSLFQQFGGIGTFHEEVLQPFNREIFSASLVTVIGFVVIYLFDFRNRVADLMGLALLIGFTIFNTIKGLSFIDKMAPMAEEYLALDFTQMLLAAGVVYDVTTRTFEYAKMLYMGLIIVSILFVVISVTNSVIFYIKDRGGKINEQN